MALGRLSFQLSRLIRSKTTEMEAFMHVYAAAVQGDPQLHAERVTQQCK